MKTVKVALLGFGSVAQSFARLLLEKEQELKEKYDTTVKVIAIATKTRGIIVDAWGVDLERALNIIQSKEAFPSSRQSKIQETALQVAETVDYDVLVELTPLESSSDGVATAHIEAALKRGKHAICANKGPLAWHFKELQDLAVENDCIFRYEAAILDGTPVFNIVRENMQLCDVIEIKGILSRTLNYMITGMSRGRSLEEMIKEGKARGFIEANVQDDLSGKDSLVKIIALANALMDANITPDDPDIYDLECFGGITPEAIAQAAENDCVIKYMCRAFIRDGKIRVSAKPEQVSKYDMYAKISGTSLAVSITTDLMGTITIVEESSAVEQAGYGVLSDLISIISE